MRRKTVVTLTREKGKKERYEKKNCSDFNKREKGKKERCEKKNCIDFKNEKEVKKKEMKMKKIKKRYEKKNSLTREKEKKERNSLNCFFFIYILNLFFWSSRNERR